ncbi:Uncharacterized protein BP5553_02617 [Venustampulla echinocandica]|uniref:Cyclin-dependent protein kinase regulator pho80 n=1 Tax=Venustampulla echinocandica TaxID=2656787 RepID=A0A370TRW2_9HELO|nr:Uncharacterized protein BP5553_02617 [Venustampulla echinocandica]RDL38277.1 Uncharacterized protein BP5553_02617 [Venustampulla echinocandica]
MKVASLILALCVRTILAAAPSGLTDSTTISIQPVESSSYPVTLAAIKYNPSTLTAELADFELPELSSESKLLRIGVYDPTTSSWKTSTSVTSSESFSKGYSPTLVLSLDAQGAVIGVTCKSSKIDAGQTRDFGPKVTVLKMGKGKGPELNRPVVLSAEGKLEEPVPEKTMLQKYWWVLLGATMLILTSGGGGE